MCYCVFLASEHSFPEIPLDMENRGFNAAVLNEDHPVKKWLSKPHQVQLGSHTWCACGLDFQFDEYCERNEPPDFNDVQTPAMWENELAEYALGKKCMEDYFTYLRAMLEKGDLEWYCVWDGDWDNVPVRRVELPAASLSKAPDFSQRYPLEKGLFVCYKQ
jgi:hypothetical protein